MYVGTFGDIVFNVSHLQVLTPSNITGSTGADWADHSVLGGKTKSQYLGPQLKSYQMDVQLSSSHEQVYHRECKRSMGRCGPDGRSDGVQSIFDVQGVCMIDISKTVLALSVAPDEVTQEELQDIDECLRVLYTTPMGSQEGDRRLGINVEAVLDKPTEVAKVLLTAEYVAKTAEYEPRVKVVRVEFLEDDTLHGTIAPKVVYTIVTD